MADVMEQRPAEALQYENRLLQQRNELLQHENERMLCEIEMISIELEHLRNQLQSNGIESTRTSREANDRHGRHIATRDQYEELIWLRLEREQLSLLFRQKVRALNNLIGKGTVNANMKSRVELLTSVENSASCIGTIRSLFELVEQCLETSGTIDQRLTEITDRQTLMKLQEQLANKQNSRVLLVRDPEYVVHETRWISKFEDEFKIVKNFYEQLIGKLLNRQQHRYLRSTTQTILLRYEQLELRKLEMYRLAVRIDNEQREYKLRLGRGASMQSLRLSTTKLVDCLASEQRELNRLRTQIGELVQHLSY